MRMTRTNMMSHDQQDEDEHEGEAEDEDKVDGTKMIHLDQQDEDADEDGDDGALSAFPSFALRQHIMMGWCLSARRKRCWRPTPRALFAAGAQCSAAGSPAMSRKGREFPVTRSLNASSEACIPARRAGARGGSAPRRLPFRPSGPRRTSGRTVCWRNSEVPGGIPAGDGPTRSGPDLRCPSRLHRGPLLIAGSHEGWELA